MSDTTAVDDMRREHLDNKLPSYTMVGSYPLFYMTKDDEIICADCVNSKDAPDDLVIVKAGVNWEYELYCDADGCDESIERAYDPS